MKIRELLADHQMFHSDAQMDCFITIKAGGTTYGQYKQALRELNKRYRGLITTNLDLEMAQVEYDEQMELAKSPDNEIEARKAAIEAERKRFQMEQAQKTFDDTWREFKRFYAQAVVLKQAIGELTDEKRAALDRDMGEFKMRESVANEILCTGRPSANTVQQIRSWGNVQFRDEMLAAIAAGPSRAPQLLAPLHDTPDSLPDSGFDTDGLRLESVIESYRLLEAGE